MKKLYELDTNEISLVPRGANKKKFLVFKSFGGNKEMSQKNTTTKRNSSVKKDAGDMPPKKDSAVYKDPNEPIDHEPGASYNAPISDRAKAALKAMARIAAPHKDELKGEHIEMAMKEAGLHGAGEGSDDEDKNEIAMQMAMPMDVKEEHHAEAMGKAKKKAEKAYKKALAKLGYRKYPDEQEAVKAANPMEEDDDDDGVEKTGVSKTETTQEEGIVSKLKLDISDFPENQRRQLTDVFKSFDERTKELVKKNDALESELKKRDEQEKHREYVAKAASLKHLGIDQEEIVETLKDAARLGDKSYARVLKQYETLNAQAETGGLFSEIGTRGNDGAVDASQRLEALVDSVVQKADGTKTRSELYDEVLKSKEGRKLYAEYKNSRKGGA